MTNEKFLTGSILARGLKRIKVNSSFGQTLKKILHLENPDYVVIQKPILVQMAAVFLARLLGKNFYWIQNYHNPPSTNFLSLMFISRADKIIVNSKRNFHKLTLLGIVKSKIHYQHT